MKCNVLGEEMELCIAIRTSGAANSGGWGMGGNTFGSVSYRSCITTIFHFDEVLCNENNQLDFTQTENGVCGGSRRNPVVDNIEQEMKMKRGLYDVARVGGGL